MGVDSGTGVAPGWRPPTLAPAGAASNHSHLLPPCASSGSTGFRVQDAQLLLQGTKTLTSPIAHPSHFLCAAHVLTHTRTHVCAQAHMHPPRSAVVRQIKAKKLASVQH